MKANYVESVAQMSSLPFRHRTRVIRFKFNMGDSENHTQEIIKQPGYSQRWLHWNFTKREQPTLCCKPLFKGDPTFNVRQNEKELMFRKMCVGCWVKALLGISKYYSWNITWVQILMNHVFIELLFIQFYTRERNRNTLDFFDTVMFNFRAYLKIKSWSLNYLLCI